MAKKNKPPEGPDPSRVEAAGRSFSGAVGEIAKFLRKELKLKDIAITVLARNEPTGSLVQKITQVAKLLRTQIRALPAQKNVPSDTTQS